MLGCCVCALDADSHSVSVVVNNYLLDFVISSALNRSIRIVGTLEDRPDRVVQPRWHGNYQAEVDHAI